MMRITTKFTLPLLLCGTATVALAARSLNADQAVMFDRLNADRQPACEAKVTPMAKAMALPELVALRPDLKIFVRCASVLYRPHPQLRNDWLGALKGRGFTPGKWAKSSDGTYNLMAQIGAPRTAGYFALTNTIYSEVSPDSALILWVGVESQRLK